ncbi:S-methyl-5-thioribose-1-phosphate isomerase [candidate division KSB1 bacterium]|nr:S-methyl-5-thioribose-1-phosphate isomerase [candidate division KSB1 bacterium]
MPVKTIEWANHSARIIDQTRLPTEIVYLNIETVEQMGEAIKMLRIRGAPAIGIAAAFGAYLSIRNFPSAQPKARFFDALNAAIEYLKSTRPTAVNLFWALDRMQTSAQSVQNEEIETIKRHLLEQALAILEEDRAICRQLAFAGADLIKDGSTILTHCNAGGLATSEWGTAVGVIYAAVEQGKNIRVFADETRPLLQGARLTTWELMESGIDVTLICDNMAAFVMQQQRIDCIIVGADRIARNGDTANKIGTYNLAVLAEKHKLPFYIAAPVSTFDLTLTSGEKIPIEERDPREITEGFGTRTAPENVKVYNPAFDVTPNSLIHAFITEKGVIKPPFESNFQKFFK